MLWYVLRVSTGQELKVKVQANDLGFHAMVPRSIIRYQNNKDKWYQTPQYAKKTQVLMPGYVFLQMQFTPEIYYQIKAIADVIGFVGMTGKEKQEPVPLTKNEVLWVNILNNHNRPAEASTVHRKANGQYVASSGILHSLNRATPTTFVLDGNNTADISFVLGGKNYNVKLPITLE